MLNSKFASNNQNHQTSLLSTPIRLAFILSIVYWVYLLFTSRMHIVHDASLFESLGKMLYHWQWVEFFKSGNNSEPVFPLLIAASMRMANLFSISYQTVQTVLQILALFSSQILMLLIFQKTHVAHNIRALVILYLGTSPALINATFSLWSEIVTFPLVLGIILISVKSWEMILRNQYKKVIWWGICLALMFITITSIKALFEYIFVIFMIPYLFLMFKSILKRERKTLIGSFLFLVTTFFLFNAFLYSYKSLNMKYNGHFMLTDRGPYVLYGNIAKRSEPLNLKRFLSCLATVPGDGVCRKLYGDEGCYFWTISVVEKYGRAKENELKNNGFQNREIDRMLVSQAKKLMLEKPIQQTLMMVIESFKMLFWESTQVGFVHYPAWLQNLFNSTLLKNGLRLSMFLITFISVLYTAVYVARNKDLLFHHQGSQSAEAHIYFFILVFVISYTGLYSLFLIITRYASPIASLYLIMIGLTLQKLLLDQKKCNK